MSAEGHPSRAIRRALSEEEAEAAADAAPMDEVMADFRRAIRDWRRAEKEAAEAAADDAPSEEVMAGFRAAVSAADARSPEEQAAAAAWVAGRPPIKCEPPPKPDRSHLMRDEWLVARPGPLAALIGDLIPAIDATEGAGRVRGRKAADKAAFDDACTVLLANLARAVLDPPGSKRVACPLGNRRERRPHTANPSLGEKTGPILKAMASLGIIDEVRKPLAIRGEAASFAPMPAFIAAVLESGAGLLDLGRSANEWPLKLGKQQPRAANGKRPSSVSIHYDDTEETDRMAAQMRRLNAFLRDADLDFVDDGLGVVDVRDRQMRRIFLKLEHSDDAPEFNRGGRLYGGFWLTLKRHRRSALRIDGEPVADLDFSSMYLRLAFARAGAQAPMGDLYALPGLGGYRSGVKCAVNALLFHRRLPNTWGRWMAVGEGPDGTAPRESQDGESFTWEDADPCEEIRGRLPDGWPPKHFRKTLFRLYPCLEHVVRRGIGYELTVDESRVLLGAMEEMMSQGITALPMHDGLLCPRSRAKVAKEIMEVSARAETGYNFPVVVDKG